MQRDNPLAERDFVLLWLGTFVSLLGTQMTWVAVPYQVYVLSGKDPLAMGAVGIVRAVPIILVSLVGGVVADVIDRRRLLMVTQSCFLAVSATLAVATLAGWENLALVYTLVALSGLLVALDLPARQALLPNLVGREAFPRAVTLNTWTFQISALVGPALAGVVLAAKGPGTVYAIDAASFAAVLVSLALMRHRPDGAGPRVRPGLRAAIEGVRFVWSQPVIWVTMTLDFLATFFADARFLMPIFAKDLLGGTDHTLGILLAAPAAGAAVTAFALSWAPPLRRQGALVVGGVAIYGLATVGFGLADSILVAIAMLALAGAADTVSMIVRHTLRQELTPDELRARMVSVNMVFFVGGPLLGEFEAGIVARLFDPRVAVVSGGLMCVASAALCLMLAPWLWTYERRPATAPPQSPASQRAIETGFRTPGPGDGATSDPGSGCSRGRW